jgi:RNA recognition motif-containing protein
VQAHLSQSRCCLRLSNVLALSHCFDILQGLLDAVCRPSTVILTRPSLPIPERSRAFWTYPQDYMCDIAPAHLVNSDMDNTPPPPGMLPISTQQPYPPMNPSTQSQSPTHPSASVATSHNPSLAPDQDVPGLDSRLPNANSPPPHLSPPLFRHRGSYAGHHVSPPHTHPPHMAYSSPSFVIHHHPGTPGREASMSHMAYASPSTMSVLQPHGPVYSYQGASGDLTPSPHQTYGAGTAPTFPVYLRHRDSSSHSLAPGQATTSSTGEAQHHISYSSPVTYSPLRYTTRPPFVYPPTSFVPAPSIYGPHYPPQHTHSYGSPHGQENQGVWWYHPPSATAATRSFEEPGFGLQFNPSPVPQNEGEQSQTRTAAPYYPSQTPFLSRFGGPSDPRTETTPSSLPAPLISSPQTRTIKTPPLTESGSEWPQERRSYHPKLPAHRSEWVMWVGNVPSDVTPDELRVFFNRPPESSSQSRQSPDLRQVYGGVSSVFLIARSNCAFVNFESEAQLEAAIARFHGKPIHPDNLPCPRLVCRVRKRTDDLKAGVGAQRGNSMHVKWIKEQRESAKLEGADSRGLAKATGGLSSPLSTSDDDGQGRSSAPCSRRSWSPASTDSGILSRYFPRRYFILKSLTQVLFNSFDVDVMVDILTASARSERSDKCLGDTAAQRGNFGSSISH